MLLVQLASSHTEISYWSIIHAMIIGGAVCLVTGSPISTLSLNIKDAEMPSPAECFDAGKFRLRLDIFQ